MAYQGNNTARERGVWVTQEFIFLDEYRFKAISANEFLFYSFSDSPHIWASFLSWLDVATSVF